MMSSGYPIGMFGTFDLENYGDLLFPLIAEAQLARRLGPVNLSRFSYHARTSPEWPYTVVSLADLPRLAGGLQGALIGGGHIVRFDSEVATGYKPPVRLIHHPTGYWLTPALIALQHGIPVAWNAPGLYDDIPAWASDLMKLAFDNSQYVSVRDELSRTVLARFTDPARIHVVPDTAFGVSELLDDSRPSPEFARLCQSVGLGDPYIIVQSTALLEPFLHFLRRHSSSLKQFHFLALPLGPALGDHDQAVTEFFPELVRLPSWPPPLLLAELISHASAVVGRSFHLAVTALAFGVPVFTPAPLSAGKYGALAAFEQVYPLPEGGKIDLNWFVSRVGKTAPSAKVNKIHSDLEAHWDRIAAVFRAGIVEPQPALNQFWQSLPYLFETNAYGSMDLSERAEVQTAFRELEARLDLANAEIQSIYHSRSWKLTAPLRSLMARFKQLF